MVVNGEGAVRCMGQSRPEIEDGDDLRLSWCGWGAVEYSEKGGVLMRDWSNWINEEVSYGICHCFIINGERIEESVNCAWSPHPTL